MANLKMTRLLRLPRPEATDGRLHGVGLTMGLAMASKRGPLTLMSMDGLVLASHGCINSLTLARQVQHANAAGVRGVPAKKWVVGGLRDALSLIIEEACVAAMTERVD